MLAIFHDDRIAFGFRYLITPAPNDTVYTMQTVDNNGTNVVVSWAAAATGFTLEAKADLNSSTWDTVFPFPVISGTNYVATNEIIGPARFYRLRQ
jgi:hypothetical protein